MKIGVKELPFFGHLVTDEGLKIDESNLQAILKLDVPDDRQKLERFLGMINYSAKFPPNLAEPLRKSLKRVQNFSWISPKLMHLKRSSR